MSRLRRDCHTFGLTPVFQFVTLGRKVCATFDYSITWLNCEKYINYLKKHEPLRAIKGHVNDRLSPHSLCLIGKSLETRPCSFCSRARVRRNSLEVFGTSSDIFGYYRTLTKNLDTLRIKMSRPYLKNCWQVYLLRRLVKNVTPENFLESNDTSLWRHTARRLANRTIPPPY